ncbi:tRNA lysidine(34) synthetase TilS [Solilutibacter silvestris]|uniref:tRNA(Ile)-lysidine synthase n=1 Tax=Solilutibacter silvestris TaxID=1645665 RepID=A0A2K1Q3K9_9GAMM|nr:tRNA lysidine(34) synthetase TilS [Lysobacter silvestris]PNS09537.1 tRNA(Ile)-lysidine synthetase [Lysobacter silvestris]
MSSNTSLPLIPSPVASDAAVVVGLSGGLDSTVLLHRLHREMPRLRALHVHHGLHPEADVWAEHCVASCAELDVPLRVARVEVDHASGLGLEGAARDARHAVFKSELRDGEVLALAHHRDDQAETFLLRALRASGNDGLSAMRAWREYATGWLWRPLLDTSRADIREYACMHGLRWIEDPSNASSTQDRNFLRNEVMPLLRQRWPQASAAFARSAQLAAETMDRAADGIRIALRACRRDDGDLDVTTLHRLPADLRADVVRLWVADARLPPLPGSGITTLEHELLPARRDAQAEYRWQQARIVRWRDRLHAEGLHPALDADFHAEWNGRDPLSLPDGTRLQLHGAEEFDRTVQVRARHGGERIHLPNRDHSHSLKHALQQADIPPWLRERLPLLMDGDEVLAAGPLHSARLHDWLIDRHARLDWQLA